MIVYFIRLSGSRLRKVVGLTHLPRSRIIAGSLLCLLGLPHTGHARDPGGVGPIQPLDEVVVTGALLPDPLELTSSLTTVTREQIRKREPQTSRLIHCARSCQPLSDGRQR
jgi:hypothetical protein